MKTVHHVSEQVSTISPVYTSRRERGKNRATARVAPTTGVAAPTRLRLYVPVIRSQPRVM
jgi:hypothetical protein